MHTFLRKIAFRLYALLAVFALAFAPGGAQAQTAYGFSQQELDQMLAPIALYPDALLSQILMAATYPMEVVEAARWSRDRPDLSGEDAVLAAELEDWDPSVISLVAFPQVLQRMRENLQWTQALGDAFLGQQSQVLDTVQALRRKAQAAGTLRSDDRLRVLESGPSLLLQPVDSRLIHVPYYDPQVVYGPWWWPAYPPVYLRPWPGYYARPAYLGGIYWGPSIGISARYFVGAIDWRQRQVRVAQVNNTYYNDVAPVRQPHADPKVSAYRPGAWQHDPDHRGGLGYNSVDAQQRFGPSNVRQDRGSPAQSADARRSSSSIGARPDTRFETRPVEARSGTVIRPQAQPAPAAPIEMRITDRRAEVRPPVQTGALPPRDTVPVRPAHTDRIEIHPQLHANPQAPRMEIRAAPVMAHHERASMAVARQEPAARHEAPHASAPPHAEIRPPQAAARQEPGAKLVARPRTGP